MVVGYSLGSSRGKSKIKCVNNQIIILIFLNNFNTLTLKIKIIKKYFNIFLNKKNIFFKKLIPNKSIKLTKSQPQ
jgi:hypothetical protein